MVEVNHN
jgi:hypothetical protein